MMEDVRPFTIYGSDSSNKKSMVDTHDMTWKDVS